MKNHRLGQDLAEIRVPKVSIQLLELSKIFLPTKVENQETDLTILDQGNSSQETDLEVRTILTILLTPLESATLKLSPRISGSRTILADTISYSTTKIFLILMTSIQVLTTPVLKKVGSKTQLRDSNPQMQNRK